MLGHPPKFETKTRFSPFTAALPSESAVPAIPREPKGSRWRAPEGVCVGYVTAWTQRHREREREIERAREREQQNKGERERERESERRSGRGRACQHQAGLD